MKSILTCMLLVFVLYGCSKVEPGKGDCVDDCYIFEGTISNKLTDLKLANIQVELVCTYGEGLFYFDHIKSIVNADEQGYFYMAVADSLVEGSVSSRLVFGSTEENGEYIQNERYLEYDRNDLNSIIDLDTIAIYHATKINFNLRSELQEVFSVNQLVEIKSENSPNGEKHEIQRGGSNRVEFESAYEIKMFQINLFSDALNTITLRYKTSQTGDTKKIVKEIQNTKGIVDDILFEIIE